MSPEKQRISIAEAYGWTRTRRDYTWYAHAGLTPKSVTECLCGELNGRYTRLPDYLNDLDAMHEATRALDHNQLRWYRNNLIQLTGTFEAIDATAAQRAEAFLRTIGKWEDDK